ncbi:MAG: AMP-binding protein [Pusillimonas sp.]
MSLPIHTATKINIHNTIPQTLVTQAELYGAKPLICFPRDGDQISYEALLECAEASSTRLCGAYRFERGMIGALYLGNSANYVKAWFSCLFAGLIDAPVNHEFKKSMLLFGLSTAQAQLIFTDEDGVDNLLDIEVRDYLKNVRLLVLAGKYDLERVKASLQTVGCLVPVTTLEELTAPISHTHPWREIEATSGAVIRYTSGTTGPAKGILQSHLHVLGKSATHNRILEFSHHDILYSPFPMHHNLASINGLIGTLQAGGTMVSVSRFSASRFWQEARQCNATLCHLLQSIAPLVSAQPSADTDRQHNVRAIWTGGPDPEFEERFNTVWIQTYALGEIGAISFKRGGACGDTGTGMPLPEMEVQIANEMDEPVAVGEQGEITIRPRHPHRIMLAYHNNLPATMRAFRNLWYHTGDAGFISESGELHFLGRMGDTIRRRGVNISSQQIEDELRRCPGVLDCAVIAVPAPQRDQEIHACILWKSPPQEPSVACSNVAAFLSNRLTREYIPRYFEPVADLPRTNTGKVQKAQLRSRQQFGPTWDRQDQAWLHATNSSQLNTPCP